MTAINFMKPKGTSVVLVKDMPQTVKPVVFRSFPKFVDINQRSGAQLRAEIALTRSAIAHRGDFGTVQMPNGTVISKVAVDIGKDLMGKNYGGMSYEQRLQRSHEGADLSLNKLEQALAVAQGRGMGRFAGRAE